MEKGVLELEKMLLNEFTSSTYNDFKLAIMLPPNQPTGINFKLPKKSILLKLKGLEKPIIFDLGDNNSTKFYGKEMKALVEQIKGYTEPTIEIPEYKENSQNL